MPGGLSQLHILFHRGRTHCGTERHRSGYESEIPAQAALGACAPAVRGTANLVEERYYAQYAVYVRAIEDTATIGSVLFYDRPVENHVGETGLRSEEGHQRAKVSDVGLQAQSYA